MTLELVNTGAGVFTALVISATAAAAVVQMRHLRSSNQIALVLKFFDGLQAKDYAAAFRFVHDELPRLLADDGIRSCLAEGRPFPPELEPAQRIGNFLENNGLLVRLGILDGEMIIRLYGLHLCRVWDALAPLTALERSVPGRAGIWENFEYLVVLADAWIERHPGMSDYPAGMRRRALPPPAVGALS